MQPQTTEKHYFSARRYSLEKLSIAPEYSHVVLIKIENKGYSTASLGHQAMHCYILATNVTMGCRP